MTTKREFHIIASPEVLKLLITACQEQQRTITHAITVAANFSVATYQYLNGLGEQAAELKSVELQLKQQYDNTVK